jgi:hypothetical protein
MLKVHPLMIRKIVIAVAITVVAMNIFASVIFAAGTFTGNCQSGIIMATPESCDFAQYYFGFYNLSTNPFLDPLPLFGSIRRIFIH